MIIMTKNDKNETTLKAHTMHKTASKEEQKKPQPEKAAESTIGKPYGGC